MTNMLPQAKAWLANVFFCETEDQAAGAMADATRWGWLPALSGVTIAGGPAQTPHAAPQQHLPNLKQASLSG